LNKDVAYDLTQEIFIRALEKTHTLKHTTYLKSWLYKIAYHYVISYLKIIKKESIASFDLIDQIPDSINIESEYLKHEDHKQIMTYLYQLDYNHRNIIIMRYYHNLPLNEIATILGQKENTVKTRLYRGLEKLRFLMKGDDFFE
jgi:RNA polymerase sigma-70 factor, ECF subfamily